MASKLSGLYECSKTLDHTLTAGTPESWLAPHSRYYDLAPAELPPQDFQPIVTIGAGLDIVVSQRNSMFVFFQGHPEYTPKSLLYEYLREVRRFMERKIETYPNPPAGYFDDEILDELERVRREILYKPQITHLDTISTILHKQDVEHAWHLPSARICRNWLHYIAEKKVERSETDRTLSQVRQFQLNRNRSWVPQIAAQKTSVSPSAKPA